MVSFRKFLVATAALAFGASLAMAQCSSTFTTSVLRQEGVTEPLPPVAVTCTDATTNGGSLTSTYSVTVISDQPITSAPDGITLTTNHPPSGTVPSYVGTISGTYSVTFSNVKMDGGFLAGPPETNTYTFSVSGIRVNASLLTQGSTAFTSGTGLAILAYPTDKTSVQGLFAGSPYYRIATVAYAVKTLNFAVTYPAKTEVSLSQCDPKDANVAQPSADVPTFPEVFYLSFNETYNAAFQKVADEGAGATNGTRLTATFSNLPANTKLYVPGTFTDTSSNIAVALVSAPKSDLSGGTLVTKADYVAVTPGTPIVYEITAEATGSTSTVSIPVAVAYTGIPALAAATSGSVSANYAPISASTSPATTPIPRFASAAQSGSGLFGVAACSTSLLYPYITTQPGWNVGLAVSNTGADPFGNAGQGGTCAFSFYGAAGAPASAVTLGAAGFGDTTAIAAGTTAADIASNAIGAGTTFQGYAVAICNFQYAHGYAFVIGNVSGSEVAHGYLALVLQKGATVSPLQRSGQNGQYEPTGF